MKSIIFSILLIINIPFSTQFQQTQIFTTTTTTPLSKPTQVVDSQTDLAKVDQNAIWLENMYRSDSMSSSESSWSTLLQHRLQIDAIRTDSLSAKAAAGINGTVYSGLSQGTGEFLMRVGFGTPAKQMQVVLDTGSDNIWIQCKPCTQCYNQPDPIFDPTESKSSSKVLCGSNICPTTTCSQNNSCPYQISYGDGSYSAGNYMTETLTFRGTDREVNNILFGCGHDNEGTTLDGADGLLGLGWGNESFMGQAGANFSHVFSYCLVSLFHPGKSDIHFGPAALSPTTVVYTRLIRNRNNPGLMTFYYVALEGISVGGKRLMIPKKVFDIDGHGGGGVIIDSGTAVTRLSQQAYVALRDAFLNGTTFLKRASSFSIFETCYNLSGLTSVNVPTVVLHFEGADINLPSDNYIVPYDNNGTHCFAFAGTTTGELSIIGNILQQGFRVSFDLKSERIGFTPKSCSL